MKKVRLENYFPSFQPLTTACNEQGRQLYCTFVILDITHQLKLMSCKFGGSTDTFDRQLVAYLLSESKYIIAEIPHQT